MADQFDIKKIFSEERWNQLCIEDPSYKIFETSSSWQENFSTAKVYVNDDSNPLADVKITASEEKGKSPIWRNLQSKCWEQYRSFGPISALINSKADYVTGKSFDIYSDHLKIDPFLRDLIYSYRNRLYQNITGWVIRMIGEGELFLLLAFNDDGKATVRVLEPSRIGKGSYDGLIADPDDITNSLLYEYYNSKSASELIPDIRIAFNPTLLKVAQGSSRFDAKKIQNSKGNNKFRSIGGFRRFIVHWKNLTGIPEYKRDVSALSTTLESINLFWSLLKVQIDTKKSQCKYVNVISFEDTPQGRIAYGLWCKLTDDEKKASGITAGYTPGSTLVLMPGMKMDIKSPQLSRLSGENQDILNIAGAGARSPQDLFQGNIGDATYSSLRISRSPLQMEIETLQHKLKNFIKYEFLRSVFYVASKVGDFPAYFYKDIITNVKDGEGEIETVKVEPCELVNVTFPHIVFDEKFEGKVNAYLGSKHAGLSSIGISDSKIAEEMGIDDLGRQKRNQILERKIFGEPKLPPDAQFSTPSPPTPAKTEPKPVKGKPK